MGTSTEYSRRRTALLKAMRKDSKGASSALLISSNPAAHKTEDQSHSFRQHSSFYYLTGSLAEGTALLLSPEFKRPVVFTHKRSGYALASEGRNSPARSLADEIGAEFVEITEVVSGILQRLAGIGLLYYHNEHGTLANSVTSALLKMPSMQARRQRLPQTVTHLDKLLVPLRLIKSPAEIALITQSIELTEDALVTVLSEARAGTRECDLALRFRQELLAHGAIESFSTMVASGRNGAVLHAHPSEKKLKRGEFLVFDCGADLNYYAGDITRTVVVDAEPSKVQKRILNIVLAAHKRALNVIRPGVTTTEVQAAVASVLTRGLVDLGVLKGSVSALMKKGAHRPFYPHGFGHSLGLDVHDLSHYPTKLAPGMVFTVEPGLYFAKPIKGIPAGGVRIEDDIVVTRTGCKLLSSGNQRELLALD